MAVGTRRKAAETSVKDAIVHLVILLLQIPEESIDTPVFFFSVPYQLLFSIGQLEIRGIDIDSLVCRDTDHPHDSDLILRAGGNLVTELLPRAPDRTAPSGALGNVGTYLMEPNALDFARISTECDFFRDLFRPILDAGGRLAAYKTNDFVMDIGTPERYARAVRTFPGTSPPR